MKQNYTLMGGKAWCCFSVFYSRKAWGSLLTEVVSFYREFQSLFHYFVAYFSEQQGEHIKVTFLNSSLSEKICGAFILTILWSGISIRYNIRI